MMKKFELNYISSWFMKKFSFYLFDYPLIKQWFSMIVLLEFILFMKENVEMFYSS